MNQTHITNVLLIRHGGIGDTILLSPAVQAMRHAFPNSHIELAGIAERVGLLVGDGLADRAVSSDDLGFHHLHQEGSSLPRPLHDYLSQFDLILYYGMGDLRSVERMLRTRADQTIIVHPALPDPERPIHITKHYLDALHPVINNPIVCDPRIALKPDESNQARERLEKQFGDAFADSFRLCLHVGAGGKTKLAPLEFYHDALLNLSSQFPLLALIAQGPADEKAVVSFQAMIPSLIPHGILKDMPLRQLAATIRLCDLHIGNDSGITHLAAASGCPTISVFIATNPAVWSPLGNHTSFVKLKKK